jgi:hypothetical protein
MPTCNFKTVDWEAFKEGPLVNLADISPPGDLKTDMEIQMASRELTAALQKTIEERIQDSKPCPHLKRWWNSNLQALKKKLNKLSSEAFKKRTVPNHLCHESRKLTAQQYGSVILNAKKKHWTDFLEEAMDRDLWTTNCYLKDPVGNSSKSQIPTLKIKEEDSSTREVASNTEKADVFHKIFFLPKPANSLVPENYQYQDPFLAPPVISMDQVRQHINSLSPYKASSPDEISNIVLQIYLKHIKDHLIQIF